MALNNFTRYHSSPQIVEAVQYLGQDLPGVIFEDTEHIKYVITIQGVKVRIRYGEYVIREPDGVHYYPCASDIFERKYFRDDQS